MVGETVQNFTLKDQNGNDFDLYENLNQKILLAFYPKDNSPVCTRQLSNYQNNLADFEKNGIKITGVNIDGIESHEKFCNSLGIKFPLLYDKDKIVSRNFDALNFLGMNKRKLVLIGTDRKILFVKNTFSVQYLNSTKIFKYLKDLKLI